MDACVPACLPAIASCRGCSGRLVACARSMCKECFTDSKPVVKLDNGRSVSGRPCFFLALGRRGMERTLRARKIGSRTRMSTIDMSSVGSGDVSEGVG